MSTHEAVFAFAERNLGAAMLLDLEGRIRRCTPSLADATGLGAACAEGALLADLLAPTSADALRAGLVQARQGQTVQVPVVAGVQGAVPLALWAEEVQGGDGTCLLWSETTTRGEDRSMGRREAECRLRIAEMERTLEGLNELVVRRRQDVGTLAAWAERYKGDWSQARPWLARILDALPDDYAVIDTQRVVVMSSHGTDYVGRACHEVFFKRERPCADCHMVALSKSKKPQSSIKARAHRHLEVHEIPVINGDNEFEALVMVYRDVTEREHLKLHLQRANRLASLGQLVSGVGHEINNPNQFIRGNIKIVRQALEDMLPILDAHHAAHPDLRIARLPYAFLRQHLMTLVDDMAHGSERIKGIVEGLRHFAQKDDGLLVDAVHINPLVEACARLVGKEVSKVATLELGLGRDIPTFTGNNHKIEQILVNLIMNAAQAMPQDRKGSIQVLTSFDPPDVVVEVRDDGKGMTERTVEKIFDPFFTTRRSGGGTGLGLAITHRAVVEHGGTISVSSKPGLGTSIAIRIPVERAQEQEP